MQCPVDGATLVMTERSGVEIDYCPTCRGVWLDRGELDKIIDRMAPPVALTEPARPEPAREPAREAYREPPRDALREVAGRLLGEGRSSDDRRNYGDKMGEWRQRDDDDYRKRRKKGLLGELFDF
jgi:Zn-finger nucleic acid-binding protein